MKVEFEELEKNKVLLKVEVPQEEIKKSVEKAYKSIAKKVNIPGFRKGKIPSKVIDAHFGEDAVVDEMLKELIASSYVQAVENVGIKPIDVPEIDIKEAKKDKVHFHAKVDVKPKVMLGNYKKLKAKKNKVKVTEEEVAQQIELARERFASLEVAEGKVVSKGDFVLIDFDGLIEGKSFEGGSAKDYLLEVGSNIIVPDFDKNILGACKDEIKKFVVDIPPKFRNPAIADKSVNYKVLIKEVKQKILPELNDEFANIAGGFETMDEYKKDIRKRLEEMNTFKAEEKFRREILDEVSKKVNVEIPDIMIDRTLAEMVDEFLLSIQARGIPPEDYFSGTGTSIEELKSSFREGAKERTKDELVLEAIAKEENIKVEEDELDKEIEVIAQKLNEDKRVIKKNLEERGVVSRIEADILMRKTMESLIEMTESKKKIDKQKDEKSEVKKDDRHDSDSG
ncbi:MAG TPA: trigger factor [Actinobacteria bacterium]|nr:trigger factor [Actinomycetota bacterium]